MDRIQLTKNFYLDEFTRSETAARHGIDIIIEPGSEVFYNIKLLCELVLQPLRDALGPVHIISGYRPFEVNRLVGGSKHSQHIYGLAVDLVVSGYTPLEVSRWIKHNINDFDQLIHEFGQWTHVSIAGIGQPPRKQYLTAVKVKKFMRKPKTTYIPDVISIDDALKRAA